VVRDGNFTGIDQTHVYFGKIEGQGRELSAQLNKLMYLVKACCEMSRRDGAIVAWHEVPGQRHPKRAVP
jgi:hypothetical protein